MKKLYILDGSGYMYRAYHALPFLSNKTGENQNAVFGFFRMVFKLLQEKPDYFVIAWDSPVKTLRKEQYAEYKANRPEIPDEFKNQIKLIQKLCAEIKLNSFMIDGYEADDIIYTLVKNLKSPYLNIYIESLDKDLKQLIDEGVFFHDANKLEIIDRDKFVLEFGFEPKCILDYLALLGDASDNIPGAKGIGKKTAQDLICTYCTIDGVYQNIEKVSPSVKEKLLEYKQTVYKGLELIKLYEIDEMKNIQIEEMLLDMDFDLFKKVFLDEMGFKSFEKSLGELKKLYQSGNQLSLF